MASALYTYGDQAHLHQSHKPESPEKRKSPLAASVRAAHDARTAHLETGFARFLRALEVLVGPAVLADIVMRLFHLPDWVQAGVATLTCLVCATVMYKGYLKFLTKYLGGLLSVLLAAALIFEVVSNRNKDPMVGWERQIAPVLEKCGSSDPCIANALTSIRSPNPGDLSSDLLAAKSLLQNDNVKNMLYTNFGITDSFYGTGFSQPNGGTNYWDARIPEYLIPNFSDKINRVWTWKLQPEEDFLNMKLSDVLKNVPPLVPRSLSNGSPNFLRYIEDHFKKNLLLNDSSPVVVRFAQMPASQYSDCMGRQNARRVFASHLGEILGMDMTIGEAVSYSGHLVKQKQTEQVTFIWVFIPSTPDEVVPANWSSLLPKVQTWVAEPKACPDK